MTHHKEPETQDLFPAAQWITWLAALVVAAVSVSAFAFTTFQTKEGARINKAQLMDEMKDIKSDLMDQAKENKLDLIKRLDRLEDKFDARKR